MQTSLHTFQNKDYKSIIEMEHGFFKVTYYTDNTYGGFRTFKTEREAIKDAKGWAEIK